MRSITAHLPLTGEHNRQNAKASDLFPEKISGTSRVHDVSRVSCEVITEYDYWTKED